MLGVSIVLALVGASLPSAAQAIARHYQLDIPREPLDSALKDFARQTGLQIARFADVSSGTADVGPVTGTLTPEDALNTLLGDSKLTYRVLSDRMIAVVSKESGAATPGSAAEQPSANPSAAAQAPQEGDRDEQKAGRSFLDRFHLAQVDQGSSADAAVSKDGAAAQNPAPVEEVVVTGIRYSVESSLAAKRAAIQNVEVVTSEDVGKLPDKNVADVLQRVPGVNTQSAASGEGGFDENNRVSIRGTPASLTQTTINGHAVATGDWFITDQSSTAGRSVSYDLLPSEMVARTMVYKTQSADMVEGGVAGSVDLQTPRPFDFKQGVTASALLGGVYSDLPAKADPQANALLSWQNGQFGALAMGFFEERDTRRDGQEVLGYKTIPGNLAAAWQAANPSLPNAAGAQFPTLIGQSLFQQTRKREGGLLDLQAKPSDTLSFDFNVFYSHLDADNRNDNPLFFGNHLAPNPYNGGPVLTPSSLTVRNGTVTGATFPTIPGQPINDAASATHIPYNSFVYDQIDRPGDVSETEFVDLSGKWQPTDRLAFDGGVGFTYGLGNTPVSEGVETQGGNGGSFQLNGTANPVGLTYAGINTANPGSVFLASAFGDINKTIDKETYAQLNGLFKIDSGAFQSIKAGVRFAAHEREDNYIEKPQCAVCTTTAPPLPAYGGGEYPANYRNGIDGGGGVAGNLFRYSNAEILNFDATALLHGPSQYYWPGSYDVKENDASAYVMANVGGDHWSGNFGVRVANTLEGVLSNLKGGTHPILGSMSGPYTPTKIDNHYLDVLPSANFKFDLSDALSWHVSVAKTMSRPDYSALGGSVALTDLNDTAAGGNPSLKPVRSTNYDTTLAWYFAPQSLLELGLFYMDLSSYVDFGTYRAPFFNLKNGDVETYTVTAPFNTAAKIKGVELGWTQPLAFGFGALANFTYADGATGSGTPVVGNSKYTYNVGGYFERWGFSANLDYTFRSHYLVGLDHSSLENEDDWGNLDASATYNFSPNFALNLNVLNITNETIKYYAANRDQPRAFYVNGRQFYFGVRLKL